MAVVGFAVEGIADLQRALRRIDNALPREMRKAGNEAAQAIVHRAQTNASTRMERRAASTVRAASQQRSVNIKLGSNRVPFALGAEFGADRNRRRQRSGPGRPHPYVGYRQFPAWTGSGPAAGRFFYPAIRSEGTRVVTRYLEEIDKMLRSNGFA